MLRKSSILIPAFVAAISLAACNKEIGYNSNTGHDGSRDSATQLLVNTNKIDDISAPTGDNEDWFYFIPPENGLITVSAFIDKPEKIIAKIAVYDGFGRTLHSLTTNHSQNTYDLMQFEVAPDRYFISIITTDGESNYTIKAAFEVPPPPEPEFECTDLKPCADPSMTCVDNACVLVEVDKPIISKNKCVPRDKCKPGQKNCCKEKEPNDDKEPAPVEEAKTIRGTIVLVTPRGDGIADVKINGIGSKKGVKKGDKAILRGLNRNVNIYSCLNTSCQATIKATSDELSKYDAVDVYVE